MHDRTVQAIAAVVLVACLGGAAVTNGSLARQRREDRLVTPLEGATGMPPHVALATAALGTFRGLAVDALWARADALQDKGDFFEAQTLSQWITALQPRFPKVWGFQAWNLAYNISVCTNVPDERWGWVNRGVELLRSRGIPLNPTDSHLPFELGWLFFHKIGGKSDREHWYYKARLAREFREILGDLTGGRTTAEALDRFRRIVAAPDDLADRAAADADVRDALALLAAHDARPDEAFLRMLGRVSLYTHSLDARLTRGKVLPTGTNRPLLAALQADARLSRAVFDVIVPCLQKRTLRDRYRMDPAFMLAQMEAYGPLDWAHPHAHGIYWSERGLALARESPHRGLVNELTVVKTRLGNLQQLMRSGRVEFDPLDDRIDLLPDPRFIEGYERGMQAAVQQAESAEGLSAAEFGRATVADLLRGYESFLQQATVFAYLYGDEEVAAGCFGKLQELAAGDGRATDPLYRDGLQEFLSLRLAKVMEIDVSNTRQFLDAMVRRAALDGLAKGRLDTFNRFLGLAHRVYDMRFSASDPQAKHVAKEAQLPPFPELVDASLMSLLKQDSLSLLERARIWAWAPEVVKRRTWGRLAEPLAAACAAAGLDFTRAFPAPPGVDDAAAPTDDEAEAGDGSATSDIPGPGAFPGGSPATAPILVAAGP
ncbi:MAG: hypothetical protein ACKONH_07500 [Planctomycetia bacterium]